MFLKKWERKRKENRISPDSLLKTLENVTLILDWKNLVLVILHLCWIFAGSSILESYWISRSYMLVGRPVVAISYDTSQVLNSMLLVKLPKNCSVIHMPYQLLVVNFQPNFFKYELVWIKGFYYHHFNVNLLA